MSVGGLKIRGFIQGTVASLALRECVLSLGFIYEAFLPRLLHEP